MAKYYITNGDKYVASSNSSEFIIGGPVTQAKRFKSENAVSTLKVISAKYPEYCVQKYYSSNSHKNYVITNASKFVGDNDTIVGQANKARIFKTAADADGYIRSKGELIVKLGEPIIVNSEYEPVDIYGNRKLQKSTLEKIHAETPKKTQRQRMPKLLRHAVYEKDKGVCQICGKQLDIDNFTVDHVVPLNRGGLDDLSNYRCLCERCNQWKGDSLDSELVTMLGDVGSRYIYMHPMSDISMRFIRAMVRGVIYNDIN